MTGQEKAERVAELVLAVLNFEDMVRRNVCGDRSDAAVDKAKARLIALYPDGPSSEAVPTPEAELNEKAVSSPPIAVLRKALEAYQHAFHDLFQQCCSNPIKNAWGAEVNTMKLNEAFHMGRAALDATKEHGNG